MSNESTSLVREVLETLREASVPPELAPVAFERVFDLLAGSLTPRQQDNGKGLNPVVPTARRVPGAGSGEDDSILGRIASRLGISVDIAEQVYFVAGDTLEVVLPPSRFDVTKSKGTEQIALLVAAGRQGGGLDEDGWTSVNPIRVVAEHYKRYDTSNFATTIRDMHEVFTVRGAGRDRKVRMTAPAWQRATELVNQLTGGA